MSSECRFSCASIRWSKSLDGPLCYWKIYIPRCYMWTVSYIQPQIQSSLSRSHIAPPFGRYHFKDFYFHQTVVLVVGSIPCRRHNGRPLPPEYPQTNHLPTHSIFKWRSPPQLGRHFNSVCHFNRPPLVFHICTYNFICGIQHMKQFNIADLFRVSNCQP